MGYNKPTSLEIRISSNLQKIAAWLEKQLNKRFKGRVQFLLIVTPERKDEHETATKWSDVPIASYVTNMGDRETSALVLLELVAKWQANKELKPLHELRDADGKSLSEILKEIH